MTRLMNPESEENVTKVLDILERYIAGATLTREDSFFWDSCYPWIETNIETKDLLQEAYASAKHW